ncbi:peptidase [Mycolicibacterium cyprinidarum]|uniref:Peptidase n=1 Tax=Mycolicibacterium cyprinidarum TaxID=2860311 RepID=A0ABQ4V6L5_9MYCO|nr:peptidase [Mycolicibacterium sp. NGTWSNA01]GJF18479.1 peptidase [Mycolicibacterium sp. NGTWS0302]
MLTLTCAAVIATSCSPASPTVVDGRAVSMRFDPNRVAGLPATDGPSGPLVPEPSAVGRVRNTDDGQIDRSALLAIEDIEEFWQVNYPPSLPGDFAAVSELVSVDPDEPRPKVCGKDPDLFAFNAAYCRRQNVIVWDRVELLPVAEKYFGDLSINALLAHEYGHAIQNASGLVNEDTDVLVREQQADCFTGVYLRWVAEGSSPRFAMNTTDALDKVLAGAIAIRDRPPDFTLFGLLPGGATHGTALDRVSAFQQGFDLGADSCGTIDAHEIQERRGDDIPAALFDPASPHSDMAITEQTLSMLIAVLNDTFAPARPPTLRTGGSSCGSGPALYCANTNTIDVDLAGLEQLGTPASESQRVLLQGDNSAISAVASRYMLAVQNERELAIDGPTAAMRTACLTGVAQSKLADPAVSDDQLVLGAGDLDEAVSGLLTNGIAASDAQGVAVPSGFTRILAFRLGLSSDVERCFRQFR